MKGRSFSILIFLLVAFMNDAASQWVEAYVNGNIYPRHGSYERYEITFSQSRPDDASSPIQFYVYGGQIVDYSTSSYYGNPYMLVHWTTNDPEGYIEVTGWAYCYKTIYLGDPVQPGSISSPYPYFNSSFNRAVINTTPATDGTCSGYYIYTWQNSTDGSTWTDFGGGETYPDNLVLSTRTFIRRQVDCNGDIKYSNVLELNYRSANWENRNLVTTTEVKYPGKFTMQDVDAAPAEQKKRSTIFYDGLGRPEQEVSVQATPDMKDLVTIFEYDALGREAKKNMPYATAVGDGFYKLNALAAQQTWLGDPTSGKFKGENHFYTETQFETSPLSRTLKTMPAGLNWGGSGVGVQQGYDLNGPDDNVRSWQISGTDINDIPISAVVCSPFNLS